MRGNFIYKKIGKRLAIERERKRMSQERVAMISEMDRTYLARIEAGKANPSLKILSKISKVLSIKLFSLFKEI